jgi:hypothetical protein
MMRLLLSSFLVAAFLGGCASVPMGDVDREKVLKTFPVNKEKASVYVCRNSVFGSGFKLEVRIDDRLLGFNGGFTFLHVEASPGKHTIMSVAEDVDSIDIEMESGKSYFLVQEPSMGLASARSRLYIVSEEEGKRCVIETRFARSSR